MRTVSSVKNSSNLIAFKNPSSPTSLHVSDNIIRFQKPKVKDSGNKSTEDLQNTELKQDYLEMQTKYIALLESKIATQS